MEMAKEENEERKEKKNEKIKKFDRFIYKISTTFSFSIVV